MQCGSSFLQRTGWVIIQDADLSDWKNYLFTVRVGYWACFLNLVIFWKIILFGHHNWHQNWLKRTMREKEGTNSVDLERTNKFLVPIPLESPSLFKGWSELWDCLACFWLQRAGRSIEGVGLLCVAVSHMGSLCNISLKGKERNTVMIPFLLYKVPHYRTSAPGKGSTLWHAEPTTFLIAYSIVTHTHTMHGSVPGCNLILSSIYWLMWQPTQVFISRRRNA